MGLGERMLLQDAFNLNSLDGMIHFLKKVMLGTFIVEGAGALAYMTVFIPQFGLRGIWVSVFTSVSAFCNAGLDIIAENSLYQYVHNPVINLVTMLLIILGGIGYIVWFDIVDANRSHKGLSLHSKMALSTTAILIFGGALAFFLLEYHNPLTIGEFSLFDKIQASFFQSITTRTAGFATVPQESLTGGSTVITMILMLIGGSPVSTAGGIKTITVAVLLASAFASFKNKDEAVLFNRTIDNSAVRKAIAVAVASFGIMILSALLLSVTTDAPMIDLLFEAVSATATVGITRNTTGLLDLWGKLIVIITMYFGRIGPISLAVAFTIKKRNPNIIKNPTEEISVG